MSLPAVLICVSMQWDDACFELLFSSPLNITAENAKQECLCDKGTPNDFSTPTLAFWGNEPVGEEENGLSKFIVDRFPFIFSIILHSTVPACGDILEATLFQIMGHDSEGIQTPKGTKEIIRAHPREEFFGAY